MNSGGLGTCNVHRDLRNPRRVRGIGVRSVVAERVIHCPCHERVAVRVGGEVATWLRVDGRDEREYGRENCPLEALKLGHGRSRWSL